MQTGDWHTYAKPYLLDLRDVWSAGDMVEAYSSVLFAGLLPWLGC